MSGQASKSARKRQKQLAFAKSQGGWGRRAPARVRNCPTPQKRRYNSREAVEANSPTLKPYRCPCGDWHARTRKEEK